MLDTHKAIPPVFLVYNPETNRYRVGQDGNHRTNAVSKNPLYTHIPAIVARPKKDKPI